MPLESGEFLDDLVDTNPVTGTDPVSEGAAHLRLIKSVLLNTFPNYGEAVDYTPAQLNDAALKSVAQIISGIWRHNAALQLGNNTQIEAANFNDDGTLAIAKVTTGDVVQVGSPAGELQNRASVDGHSWLVNAVLTATLEAGAGNGLQVERKNGGLSRVPTVGDENEFGPVQTFNGGVVNANNNGTQYTENDGTTTRVVLIVDSTNVCRLGSPQLDTVLRGVGEVLIEVAGAQSAEFTTEDKGSLLINDREGQPKKAGFRNPTLQTVGSNRATIQNDENKFLQISAAGIQLDIASLEPGTSYMITSPVQNFTIARGTGVNTLRFLDGLNGTTAFTTASCVAGSVLQVYHNSAGTVSIWGGGLTPNI
jgi:hypothetical protein